jgi:undecaprenyl-diphosphatase
MTLIDAGLLGFVQGITEFLPVSSTGHLVLAREVFSIEIENALAFDVILHLATVLAVILYFHKDIWVLGQTFLRKLGRLPVNKKEETLLFALMIGTIPAAIMGFMFENVISDMFRSPVSVAVVLFVSAWFFVYAEWKYQNQPRTSELTIKSGFMIGCFQVLALMPGFSRSGATICGGMLLGLTRVEAARFAFLLAIPIILGAGVLQMLEFLTSDEPVNWLALGVGAGVSFTVAILAIHFFLGFIRRYSLWPFIWYKFILAIFIMFVFWFG